VPVGKRVILFYIIQKRRLVKLIKNGELSSMDKEKLQQIIPFIAEKFKFRLEIIEKDYYLTLILNNVKSHLSDKIWI